MHKKKFKQDIRKLNKIFSHDSKEYERQWSLMKHAYKHIYVCRIYVGSIGEFVSRYLMIKEDIAKQDNSLYVFLPVTLSMKEVSNKNLLALIAREICIVNKDNYGFWKYVCSKHSNELDLTYYEKYRGRKDTYYDVYRENPLLSIPNSQIQICKAIATRIGISKEYVCFFNRDESYNIKVIGKDFTSFKARNSCFKNYGQSIEYLQEQNIQAVRMGKYVVQESEMKNNLVNFAERFYLDFMDIYLTASCKFYVGPNSGINMVAKVFAKPVLVVNSVYATVGSGCEINMKENILIPKKYYSKRTKKYLSLRAIARYERMFGDDTSRYAERDIEIIENTPQEIFDAVVEMNERLNGTWKDSEEDTFLQKKYRQILYQLNENNRKRFWNGGGTLYRIGSKYLRENRYLIEE